MTAPAPTAELLKLAQAEGLKRFPPRDPGNYGNVDLNQWSRNCFVEGFITARQAAAVSQPEVRSGEQLREQVAWWENQYAIAADLLDILRGENATLRASAQASPQPTNIGTYIDDNTEDL